jgi:hypothetical protein
MTTSPISLPVLVLILLSMTLSYCAGAYAQGVWMPVMLIGSGIIAVCAVFIEASEAYAAGVDSEDME